ncbi:transposase [Streptomyces sp. NPDC050287]|uniref:transposase n=1 Tax=Streptomyces sp. NPDC050287 TaxID=3365608 RepID=UPI0037B28B77
MTGRPPKGRTWGTRGITPTVKVPGRSRGRLSVAGLLCYRPGLPARLCYRLHRHTGRKGERRLLDGTHQLLKAPLIVVWDRLNTHISTTMQALVAEPEWLTIVLLPGYAPELNPVEGMWAHIKRSLANLAARTLSKLETLLRADGSRRGSTGTPSSTDSSPERASLSTDRTNPNTSKSVAPIRLVCIQQAGSTTSQCCPDSRLPVSQGSIGAVDTVRP